MNIELINEFSRVWPSFGFSLRFSEDCKFAYLWTGEDETERILIDVDRTLTNLKACQDSSGLDALKSCIYRVA